MKPTSSTALPREGTAAGAKHEVGVLEQPGDHAHFALAKVGFAMRCEDILDRHAGGFLHFLVAIDEVSAEPRGEPAAHGGLSGAHHADKHNRPAGQEGRQLVAMQVFLRSCGSQLAGPRACGG